MALPGLNISTFSLKELPHLAHLQPEGWPPIQPHYKFYAESGFSFPIKCTIGNDIAGIGSVIFHKETAWLAHIIVDKKFRNQGVGTRITQQLIDIAKKRPCKSILLVATSLGEPVYKKLGFEKESEYIFYSGGMTDSYDNTGIQAYHPDFLQKILELDHILSGENREKLILPHVTQSYLITNNAELSGFYMPGLGEGLIAARNIEAGVALMKLKHRDGTQAIVPEKNHPANSFLINHGFSEFRRGIRMWLGEYVQWRPEMQFGRIGGNLG